MLSSEALSIPREMYLSWNSLSSLLFVLMRKSAIFTNSLVIQIMMATLTRLNAVWKMERPNETENCRDARCAITSGAAFPATTF